MQYEVLDAPNGNVINVIEANEDFMIAHYTDYRLVPDTTPVPDKLIVTLDVDTITLGNTATATITLQDDTGSTVLFTQTYYVPLIRDADNWQADFLTVDLVDGVATVAITPAEKGKYIIDMQKITPAPTAELDANPVLLVV